MNYGFLIDNERCIGCHACSTACKSENSVPLGVQRTWVKSVETGVYPNVRRSFQVTRCNHCANPPCARICPVSAMYQREDGIVEFNADACIGCKACLQACPYDAIYVDPETGTAAKCHYCAHRIDIGLEPSCVVVCPEHAILAGDLDNPASEIARRVAEKKVSVRKPEQGTAPKLFYIGGEDVAMHPTAVERAPATFAWSDVVPLQGKVAVRGKSSGAPAYKNERIGRATHTRESKRIPGRQGVPSAGPIAIGDRRLAEQMTQVVYNAQHRVPWHWQVPAYLVTKAVATGAFMILGLAFGFGLVPFQAASFLSTGLLTLVFLALTTALLVADLERPERFLRILTRGQWKSWLVRGAWLLVAFSAVAGVFTALELASLLAWTTGDWIETLRSLLIWIGLPFAFGSAVYTAFLFGQAEGRDLWQSPLLPLHLVVQASVAGAGALILLGGADWLDPELAGIAKTVFSVALAVDLVFILLGEHAMTPASEAAATAAHAITHGRHARAFWLGAILMGHVVPLALAALPSSGALMVAALLAVVGLYIYEHVFVTAPQEVPNS